MENKIKFSENVILLDVAFLNEVVGNARKVLSGKLGRQLPAVDLPAWLTYLALDAGLREGNNELQVLLLHDAGTRMLDCCEPVALENLNGMACRTPLGEFVFACVDPAGITSCEALYLDLLSLALDSADVKRLLLVPFHTCYGGRVIDALVEYDQGKEEEDKAFYFSMERPEGLMPVRWDSVVYSLMRVWSIAPEEF